MHTSCFLQVLGIPIIKVQNKMTLKPFRFFLDYFGFENEVIAFNVRWKLVIINLYAMSPISSNAKLTPRHTLIKVLLLLFITQSIFANRVRDVSFKQMCNSQAHTQDWSMW